MALGLHADNGETTETRLVGRGAVGVRESHVHGQPGSGTILQGDISARDRGNPVHDRQPKARPAAGARVVGAREPVEGVIDE